MLAIHPPSKPLTRLVLSVGAAKNDLNKNESSGIQSVSGDTTTPDLVLGAVPETVSSFLFSLSQLAMLGLDSVFAFCYVLNLLSWEVSEQKEKGNQTRG